MLSIPIGKIRAIPVVNALVNVTKIRAVPAINALVNLTTVNVNAVHIDRKGQRSSSHKRSSWIYYWKCKRHLYLDSRVAKQYIYNSFAGQSKLWCLTVAGTYSYGRVQRYLYRHS